MRIKAYKVKCSELKPGDLFSTQGEKYWEHPLRDGDNPVGQKVYIRTEVPCPETEANEDIYKIKIFTNKDKINVNR